MLYGGSKKNHLGLGDKYGRKSFVSEVMVGRHLKKQTFEHRFVSVFLPVSGGNSACLDSQRIKWT